MIAHISNIPAQCAMGSSLSGMDVWKKKKTTHPNIFTNDKFVNPLMNLLF